MHVGVAALVAGSLCLVGGLASPAFAANGCGAGAAPTYTEGFAALQGQLGSVMGLPVTCAYPDPAGTGDVEQQTSAGLAYWRKATNTPTFTDGTRHWALTADSLVAWDGAGVDPPAPFSDATVWPIGNPEHAAAVRASCGAGFITALNPLMRPADAACITTAMQNSGADASAVQYFQTTGELLDLFADVGHVNWAIASAPWENMGRGHFEFVDGSPAAVSLFDVTPKAADWQGQPGYAAVLAQTPTAFPWPEYATVIDTGTAPDGSQQFDVTMPLRACRACANVAALRVTYTFDATGALVQTRVLPAETAG